MAATDASEPVSTDATVDTDLVVDTDVVVVGAGPVGLLLAGLLRLGGARVTVLEQLTEPTTESRASTLHTRTMEILDGLGLLGRLGELPGGGRGHYAGLPLDLTAAAPGHPFAGQWKCPQTLLESVLGAWVRELGGRVLRGRVVTGLREHPDRVSVGHIRLGAKPAALSARYVVGCDGERSTVRQLAGIGTAGAEGALEMLRADLAGIDVPNRRFERHPGGLATAFRWPDGSTRLMVHLHGVRPPRRTGPPTLAEVADAWRRVTGEDVSGGVPLWLDAFDDTSLQARHYVRGRVLLAGDAAHAQMPVGGQALNLGLHDAADLGPKLAAAVAAEAAGAADAAGLLEGYHEARHPVGAAVLTGIRAQARLLLGGPEVEGLRTVFAELLQLPDIQAHLARGISGVPAPEQDHPNDLRSYHRRAEQDHREHREQPEERGEAA